MSVHLHHLFGCRFPFVIHLGTGEGTIPLTYRNADISVEIGSERFALSIGAFGAVDNEVHCHWCIWVMAKIGFEHPAWVFDLHGWRRMSDQR